VGKDLDSTGPPQVSLGHQTASLGPLHDFGHRCNLAERVHCRRAPSNADQLRETTGAETAAGLRMGIPAPSVSRRIVSHSDDEQAKIGQGVFVNR
jgi:hypothetical protein